VRFIMKIRMPIEQGNRSLSDPEFGEKMQSYLKDVKAEAAYFTTVEGQRGGYIILNMDNPSQLPAIAEPLFLWLNADLEAWPAMTPEDLGKANSSIRTAVKKWNRTT
jgi:hypothetical protein